MREKLNRIGFLLLQPFVPMFLSGSTRTRGLIIYKGEILLVRNWLGAQQWSMPGGGLRKNERPKKGMVRELHEELNIKVQPKEVKQLVRTQQTEHSSKFEIIIFQIDLKKKTNFEIEKNELIEADWHKINSLPENLHPTVLTALKVQKK